MADVSKMSATGLHQGVGRWQQDAENNSDEKRKKKNPNKARERSWFSQSNFQDGIDRRWNVLLMQNTKVGQCRLNPRLWTEQG
ncbi:unnamed protein product [Gadus morhua 'NCC']